MIAWQRGIDLAFACYDCTSHFPGHWALLAHAADPSCRSFYHFEHSGGTGRFHRREFLYYISVGRGSL